MSPWPFRALALKRSSKATAADVDEDLKLEWPTHQLAKYINSVGSDTMFRLDKSVGNYQCENRTFKYELQLSL